MQNKINQKIPIAKMDELIAAVKDSGGGGSKIYRHNLSVSIDGVRYPSSSNFYSTNSFPCSLLNDFKELLGNTFSLALCGGSTTTSSSSFVPNSLNNNYVEGILISTSGSVSTVTYSWDKLYIADTVTEI